MTFTIANWACISESLNQGQETVVPFGGSSTVLNAPNVFFYGSPNDAVATIVAADYFLPQYASLAVNDWIMGNGTDASFAVIVTAVSSTSVTVESTGLTTSIGTADIINNAVTFAKMQEIATHTLLGNPTGGTTEVSEITLGNGLEFSSTTLRVPLTNLVYTSVAITAAEFNGMYDAPKELIAAQGANTLIVVDQMVLAMTFVAAAYAAGGVVAAQYDSTVHGGGVLATNSQQASDFQAAASDAFIFKGASGDDSDALFSAAVNKGIYLSNATGAFTTGDGTWVAHLWYRVIPTA
jgi:hypothetical protein